MANTLVDLVKIYATNTGTSIFALGNAVPSFRGVEALIDGRTYAYSVRQGNNYEVGTGAYDATNGTLGRDVRNSSAGGAPIPLGPNAVINFPALAEDISRPGPAGPAGPEGPQGPQGPAGDITAALLKANNLIDLPDKTLARHNLGLNPAPIEILGTAHTLVLTDDGQYLRALNSADTTITVPAEADVAFSLGTAIVIEQGGAGTVTLAPAGGVTLNSRGGALASAGQFAVFQLKKVAADEWTIVGDVA